MDKSEAMWIGASYNYRHKPHRLTWTNDTVKTLGIHIRTDVQKMTDKTFIDCLEKFQICQNYDIYANLQGINYTHYDIALLSYFYAKMGYCQV